MARTSSARKAHRVSERKRVINVRRKKAVRTTLKEVFTTKSGDNLSNAYQAIDKAVKGGIIKKNTAARMKSRASRAVSSKK